MALPPQYTTFGGYRSGAAGAPVKGPPRTRRLPGSRRKACRLTN